MLHVLVPHDSDLGFFVVVVLFYEGFFLLLSFLEEGVCRTLNFFDMFNFYMISKL